jgi:hypothetical protein
MAGITALDFELPLCSVDLLVRYPELWNIATVARACSLDALVWIDEGERALGAIRPATPGAVQAGVMASLANAYLNRGRFRDTEEMLLRVASAADEEALPLIELMREFLTFFADGYAAKEVDPRAFDDGGRLAPFMQIAGTRALIEYDSLARRYRLLGDRVAESAMSARAVATAVETKLVTIEVLCLMDASFGAWLAGEDAIHEHFLREVEVRRLPSVERGTRHYIGCARGQESRTQVGTEKLKTRAHAFVIAASLAPNAR